MKKYETSAAIVVERPREVRYRTIRLSEAREGALIARTRLSSISSGTDMKTYLGLQPPESLFIPACRGMRTWAFFLRCVTKTLHFGRATGS